ncbi:MAG: N-acetylneuraminate synthase [Candidatus Yanofskybacteria bacterium RIFCSPHIGHO2_02_FULL_41_11]|uniref:N-acetylneuraminate synthase n=1 Tax=Candidatus Yanofskybacteria bacterium RIFCSPHIGHO2_02_FULL_41_11 TaxID=1802675 RepID=A0A1F8FBQ6_9BACT|nr:MAG: N-acetylneuraminate synthase [Candidatus Yanofskybacteria bacterium RIFCSPHIGHO2_02_FULL_41_11]
MVKKIVKIGNKIIGYGRPVFIVAEAGVNHNGQLDLALKLIDAAADAGADAVKFQTFRVEQATTRHTALAGYQSKNIGTDNNLFEEAKGWELKEEWYPRLIDHCKKRGIIFFSTPHGGFESVDFLASQKVPLYKFGSGEITNLPLFTYTAKLDKPIIFGTGTATMKEVKDAVRAIKRFGNSQIVALHCTTNYPPALTDVNLRAMQTMMKDLGVLVGYSDHTLGDRVAVMAVTLGACVIEKHLTLDKNMKGPDHQASASPTEFKLMVQKIRNIEIILGSSQKKPVKAELKYIPVIRKSIVVNRDIKKGEKLTRQNLAIKKPGTGIPPKYWDKIIGKTVRRDITDDSLLKWADVE